MFKEEGAVLKENFNNEKQTSFTSAGKLVLTNYSAII